MLKINSIEGSPDQFTATLDNLDVFVLHAYLEKSISKEKLDRCGCGKCKHAKKIFEAVEQAYQHTTKHQASNLTSKMIMLEFTGEPKNREQPEITTVDPSSDEGKKLIQILKDMGIIRD